MSYELKFMWVAETQSLTFQFIIFIFIAEKKEILPLRVTIIH